MNEFTCITNERDRLYNGLKIKKKLEISTFKIYLYFL